MLIGKGLMGYWLGISINGQPVMSAIRLDSRSKLLIEHLPASDHINKKPKQLSLNEAMRIEAANDLLGRNVLIKL